MTRVAQRNDKFARVSHQSLRCAGTVDYGFEAALGHGSVLEFRGAWEKFPLFPTSTNS